MRSFFRRRGSVQGPRGPVRGRAERAAKGALRGEAGRTTLTAMERFVAAFNAGRYFEAHEILEDFWRDYRGPDRTFYQGLIQAAVALYHRDRENRAGALRVAARARARLEPWAPRHGGLDLEALLAGLEAAVEAGSPPPRLVFDSSGGAA